MDVNIKEDNAILGKESVRKTDEKKAFMTAFLKEKYPKTWHHFPYDGQSSMYYDDVQGIIKADNDEAGVTMRFQYAPRGPRKRDFTVTLRRGNSLMHLKSKLKIKSTTLTRTISTDISTATRSTCAWMPSRLSTLSYATAPPTKSSMSAAHSSLPTSPTEKTSAVDEKSGSATIRA